MAASLLPPEAGRSPRFIWLSNFEAERAWAQAGAVRLPTISRPDDQAVVNRLEEINLFLAEAPDALILREPSDPAFLAYLEGLGFRPPRILTVSPPDRHTFISDAILQSDQCCQALKEYARQHDQCYLLPYAKTRLEEAIAEKAGLQPAGPPSAVCERVNSKIYSRRVSKSLGLTTIEGGECESIEEIEEEFNRLSAVLSHRGKVVLKEAMGVSGKGLVVIDGEAKFQRLLSLLKRMAKPGAVIAFVLESWLDKLKDINYQIFVSRSGETRLLTIKEIITEGGAHMGHRFPAALSTAQIDCYEAAAQAIGARLFKDGFTGIAGIDSIIDQQDTVYPLLEINARFNMSTYQLGLDRLLPPEAQVIAKHYPLLLREPLPFERLSDSIGSDLLRPAESRYGIVLQNFATVNVNSRTEQPGPFKGRLYALLVGGDPDRVQDLDRRMSQALSALGALAPGH
jgi:hypothetical protein